jgi:hypothetical protein
MRALDSEFSDFALYSTDDSNILIVAVRQGTVPALDPRVFTLPAMRADLAEVGIVTLQDVKGRFLGDRKLLEPLIASRGIPANSDYFPFVDLRAGRARIMESDARELTGLQVLPVPFFELVTGHADQRTETMGPTRYTSTRDGLARRAVALKSAVVSGDYTEVAAADTPWVMALRSTKEACAAVAVQQAWTHSAFLLAAATSAYLSAHELGPLWDTLANMPCARAVPAEHLQFVEFLRAVSQRDVAQISRLGGAVLASNYPFEDPESLQFTTLATAASQIALDRPDAARETLGAHMAGMQLSRPADLAVRLLSAAGTRTNQR